jgi:hypothetical protein
MCCRRYSGSTRSQCGTAPSAITCPRFASTPTTCSLFFTHRRSAARPRALRRARPVRRPELPGHGPRAAQSISGSRSCIPRQQRREAPARRKQLRLASPFGLSYGMIQTVGLAQAWSNEISRSTAVNAAPLCRHRGQPAGDPRLATARTHARVASPIKVKGIPVNAICIRRCCSNRSPTATRRSTAAGCR